MIRNSSLDETKEVELLPKLRRKKSMEMDSLRRTDNQIEKQDLLFCTNINHLIVSGYYSKSLSNVLSKNPSEYWIIFKNHENFIPKISILEEYDNLMRERKDLIKINEVSFEEARKKLKFLDSFAPNNKLLKFHFVHSVINEPNKRFLLFILDNTGNILFVLPRFIVHEERNDEEKYFWEKRSVINFGKVLKKEKKYKKKKREPGPYSLENITFTPKYNHERVITIRGVIDLDSDDSDEDTTVTGFKRKR